MRSVLFLCNDSAIAVSTTTGIVEDSGSLFISLSTDQPSGPGNRKSNNTRATVFSLIISIPLLPSLALSTWYPSSSSTRETKFWISASSSIISTVFACSS